MDGTVIGKRGRVLKPMRTGRIGRKRCTIRVSTVPRIDIEVAAMVLETYVGPRPAGLWALHRDDDVTNNDISNVYWGTPGENALEARPRRKDFKLTLHLAQQIWARRSAGEKGRALAKEFGVAEQTICNVYKRRAWVQ
jgi:hypothetical protein